MKKRLFFFTVSLLSLWQLRSQTTSGLNFDGSNDYIICGNILTSSYTKEAWVKVTNTAPQNNFISGGGNGQHALWCPNTNSSKLSAGHNGSWMQVQDAVALTLGTWYHVAVTYDAATTTMKLYKNGVLISTNASVPAYTGGTFVQLGSYSGAANLLNGFLDEVRIWNYARTGTDIFNNMNCELNAPQTGLIAYYQFNQGVAASNNTGITTLNDISGNSNHGTLINFGLTAATSNWVTGSPVNPLPNVTASVTNPSVCIGDQATLSGGGASTYAWTGSVTDAVAFAPTITDTYTVTGTDANGCSNTAVQTVNVNALPNVTASVSNPVICAGDLTTLSGSGALTYTWTGSVTDAVAFAPTITDTYTVTGTDANGCSNSAVETVTVNSLPNVTINVTNASVCIGNSTTLSGNGALTYTWTGSVTDAVAFAPTITDTYTVTGTDINGCMNSAVQTVVVNNLPTVTASVSNSVVCSGNTVVFNGGGASTYLWTGGVTNNAAFTPTITDTYTVTGTDVNGCVNTAIESVTVNSLPTVAAVSNMSLICVGQSATLTASGANTYLWNTTSTNSVITVTPAATTVYTVSGTGSNGCSASFVITQSVSVCTGITTNAKQQAFNIYPNPTNGILNIESNNEINSIEITDLTGRVVFKENTINVTQINLNTVSLQNAVYILRITDKTGNTEQMRIVMQK